MSPLRHPAAVAAPGVVALVLAAFAVARPVDDDDGPVRTTTTVSRAGAPPSFAELYRRVDGVVGRIDARRSSSQPPFSNGRRTATGAAFLIDGDGHIVTNAHVVDRASSATVRFGSFSRRVDARIVGRDAATDLAVLRVDPDELDGERPLAIADPGSIDVGEPVLAVGTPYRLQSSASAGIVSGTGRQITGLTGRSVPDAVQTDAAINPGNSGGPLVDTEGRVLGVNTQGRAAGVSFAVGAATIRRVVPQLIRDGRASAAFLGVSLGEVTERGTRVTSTTDGGPAADAGIRAGDVVVRVGRRAATSEGAVASAVAALRPGQRVAVVLRRDGRDRTVTVRVATAPRGA